MPKIVFNLIDKQNYDFVDGIYSFRGMGPHFPRRIFMFNNGELFIFESAGYNASKGVVQEFSRAIDSLNLSSSQVVQYAKAISEYLNAEFGEMYGEEIE